MVVDRGYTVTTSVAADEMEQKILARDPLITGQAENSSPGAPPFVVQVITAPENKIGVKFIRELEEARDAAARFIVLARDKPTPPAMKRLLVPDVARWMSAFQFHELVRNVSRHELVTPHRLVPPELIAQKLGPWKETTIDRLPCMTVVDPMARYMGFVENDMVETSIRNGGEEEQIFYCKVVRKP